MSRPIQRVLPIAVAVLAAGCGGSASSNRSTGSSADQARPVVLAPWPSAADYGTIRAAVAVRDHALFRETDWRIKSLMATLGLQTLVTVRVGPGPCAAFVTSLYGNLLDLHEAYQGEDWRPLIRYVRRQPTLASVCGHTVAPVRGLGSGLVASISAPSLRTA